MIGVYDSKDGTLEGDPGLALLVLIARFYGIPAEPGQLRHAAALQGQIFGEDDLVLAARSLELRCRALPLQVDRLSRLPLPALVLDREGRHFILALVKDGTALVQEADGSSPTDRPLSEIVGRASGRVMLFASRASLAGELALRLRMVHSRHHQISASAT